MLGARQLETVRRWGLSTLDAQQLEIAGFGNKTALRRFPFESPEGDFADEARNFSYRMYSIDKSQPVGRRRSLDCRMWYNDGRRLQ